MNCPFCENKLIWMNDIDLEDVSIDKEKGIIKKYMCSNDKCNCEAEFILKEGEV